MSVNVSVEKYFSLSFGVGKMEFHHCDALLKKSFCPPLQTLHFRSLPEKYLSDARAGFSRLTLYLN